MSGLVFPGAGQLWLKYYLRGTVLIVGVLGSFAVVVVKATSQAVSILEKAETEGGAVDLVAILKSASEVSSSSDFMTKAASAVMVLCWIVGIIDAYLMGRKKDLADQAKASRSRKQA